jgi:cell division protein FtsW
LPAGRRARLRDVSTSTVLVVIVGALCVLGLVMVGSASDVESLALYGSAWSILIREGLWMALGVAVLVVSARLDYRRWRRVSTVLLVLTVALLLVVLVPGIGVQVMGSSRWIGFGQFRLQPSELMKLTLALFGADLLARRLDRGATYRTMAGPLLLATGAAALLVLMQPDLGTAIVLGCIALALLFGSGVPLRPVLKVIALLATLALFVAIVSPYRRARILSFLDPGAHSSTSGYQVVQSLIGLGSGHLFGLGLGSGREKWGYLPNAHTDFIFSVIGEELGLIGALVVLALLGGLAWFGLRAAMRAPDRFGSMLAVALVAWVSAETAINVGAVIGVLPVTGIPLPFISFGGSSLVITMAAAGILINIARHERRPTLLAPAATLPRGRRTSDSARRPRPAPPRR